MYYLPIVYASLPYFWVPLAVLYHNPPFLKLPPVPRQDCQIKYRDLRGGRRGGATCAIAGTPPLGLLLDTDNDLEDHDHNQNQDHHVHPKSAARLLHVARMLSFCSDSVGRPLDFRIDVAKQHLRSDGTLESEPTSRW